MKSQKIVEYGKPLQEIVEDTPTPTGTEIIVKVSHCGVCHSDVHLQEGTFLLGGDKKLDTSGNRELPFTLGHEIHGEVVALGPEASGVSVGDQGVVYPWIGCGACAECARGNENICLDPKGRNLGTAVDGGYADHVLVPHPKYLLDSSGLPDGLAGTYMCSGLTAYSALQKVSDLTKDEALLILGLGGVGYMGLQIATALFDGPIIVAEPDAAKREAAIKAGAASVVDPTEQGAHKTVLKETGGVAAAVDFVGSENSTGFALRTLRRNGRLVVVGLYGGEFKMGLPMFALRPISILGTLTGTLDEAKAVLELAKSGKIDPIPVEERPLDQASQSLDDLRNGKIVGRVVLTP